MSKLTTIDRSACQAIRDRLNQALQQDGFADLGISVEIGHGSFTPTSVTFKVECALVSSDGLVMDRDAMAFKQFATMLGLAPDDLGKTFQAGRRTYTVIGMAGRSARPILAKRDDGKVFKYDAETVKALLMVAKSGT